MAKLDWKYGEYNASDKDTDTGLQIRHLWNSRRRHWEGFEVWAGQTGRFSVNLGTFQTLGAAQHAAEAYLAWRAPVR
jgi:hypothetical protein